MPHSNGRTLHCLGSSLDLKLHFQALSTCTSAGLCIVALGKNERDHCVEQANPACLPSLGFRLKSVFKGSSNACL